jgi:hypothetical protein
MSNTIHLYVCLSVYIAYISLNVFVYPPAHVSVCLSIRPSMSVRSFFGLCEKIRANASNPYPSECETQHRDGYAIYLDKHGLISCSLQDLFKLAFIVIMFTTENP